MSFLTNLLSTVDFGGRSNATSDASSSALEAQTISNASTSTPNASSTPSQLTTAEAGEAGDQQAENEAVKTDDEINQIIASILEEAGIDYESKSDEFKYDILNKYKVMIDVASRKGETLSDDIKKNLKDSIEFASKFKNVDTVEEEKQEKKERKKWKNYGFFYSFVFLTD